MADATQKESRRAIAQVAANTRWSRYYQRKAAEAEARLAEALEELGAHAEDES